MNETRHLLGRGLDPSAGAEFVRERLALLGKTVFLLSFSFYLFLLAGLTLGGGAPWRAVVLSPVGLGHLAGSSVMGLLWLLASRPITSLRVLGALDAVTVVLGCACLAGMTLDDHRQVLQTLLAITVTVMIRAILVPSTPGRTTLLTTLA